MDQVLHSIKSFFIGAATPRGNGIAPEPNTQPRLFEAHDLDNDVTALRLTTPGNTPGSTTQIAVTAVPGVRTTSAPSSQTSSAQKPVTTAQPPIGQVESTQDELYFTAAARKGDLELVRKYMNAGLNTGRAFCEAVKHQHPEIVRLLLPTVSHDAKWNALVGMIKDAPTYKDMKAPVAIGSMVLAQLEDYQLYFSRRPRTNELREGDTVKAASMQAFRHAIEAEALRGMLKNENLRGVNNYVRNVQHPDDKAIVFIEAARNDAVGIGIARQLLRGADDMDKMHALVAMTSAVANAYPSDSFVAAGREIYQSLKDREVSFNAVREPVRIFV